MWSQTYGGTDWDMAYSVVETIDGGYAVAGFTDSYGNASRDVWLIKTDSSGNHQWNQTYGAGGEGWSVVQTSDEGYVVVGWTSSYGAGSNDVWLIKTDSSGNHQWNQTYGGTNTEWGFSVVETSDGGYAITGFTNSYGAGKADFWLVKTDSSGNHQWNQTYGGTDSDYANSLIQTSDGGYAITGETRSYGAGSVDFWLVKTNATGTIQWNQTYGGIDADVGYSVIQADDGGYAITGETWSYGAGSGNVWLVKTDANGNAQWNQTYGGGGYDSGMSLVQTSDGGYAIAGISYSYVSGSFDFWLGKTDAAGTEQWNQTYGGTGYNEAWSVVETSDGGYAVAGSTDSYGAGSYDIWLIKTDEYGDAPVIPEASWVILPLLLATTLAIFISKKKLLYSRSKQK